MKFIKSFNKTFSTINFKTINLDTINPNAAVAQYAVRGIIDEKSIEINRAMAQGKKFKFDKLYRLNIGNPHACGSQPLKYPRKVLSYLMADIQDETDESKRAEEYKAALNYSIGSSTDYRGLEFVRESIAKFISKRDRVYADKSNIIITNGASEAIETLLRTLITEKSDGLIVPIPQYPIYSAQAACLGGSFVPYYLEEENDWAISIKELEYQYKKAVKEGIKPKVLVLINPGNPTGNVVSVENITSILKFCYDHHLVLLADEVYQNNIYTDKPFVSARKIASSLPAPYCDVNIFSCNSLSKGFFGECGLRGGYAEMYNFPDSLKSAIFGMRELEMCPNIVAQLCLDLLVKPPTSKTSSKKTVEDHLRDLELKKTTLQERADFLNNVLNSVEGVSCRKLEGAMYAFPKINLPDAFVTAAKAKGYNPDDYLAIKILEETGLVTVGGSGFWQKKGTYHLRMTNLIEDRQEFEDIVKKMLNLIKQVQENKLI